MSKEPSSSMDLKSICKPKIDTNVWDGSLNAEITTTVINLCEIVIGDSLTIALLGVHSASIDYFAD